MDFLISIMSKNTSIVELFCIEKLEKMIKLRMEDRKLGDGQLEYIEKVRNIIRDFSLKTGIPIKYFARTYGCQQNENDTEKLSGLLEAMGFEPTNDINFADLIIFNTCAVREHAERKILMKNKRENPALKIVLCGCMFQQPHMAEKIKSYKQVDMILGTHVMGSFPEKIYKLYTEKGKIIDLENIDTLPLENIPTKRENSIKAWVTIMSGCNNFCSYCVVPYVRGREHSRYPDDVISEVKDLVDKGYKDITLLGQNVNSYCKDLDIGYDFSDLLSDLNKIDGKFRIRFMTSHPKDLSDRLIQAYRDCDKLCRNIHLPVQSGSDEILKAMNRHYDRASYLDKVEKLRRAVPGIGLTTDIIVGFPGETEAQFEDTLSLVEQVRYDSAYTFIYSPRKGTRAAEMPDQIPEEVKQERYDRLMTLQHGVSLAQNKARVGTTCRVLVEKKRGSRYVGRSEYEAPETDGSIFFGSEEPCEIGSFVNVKITAAKAYDLMGERV